MARLKVCTKPLGGGGGGGGLSQQKPALGTPPRAQPSCTSKILLSPSASSFRPQSERSLSDLQVGSDHLPLNKPLGLQIPGESGPASMPTSWKFSLPALLTDQLTGTRDLSLESLPGSSLPDSPSSGTLRRVPTLRSPLKFPQSSLRIVPRAGPGARYLEGIIKSLRDDRHMCCSSLFYELRSQKGRIHGASKWLRCQAQP